MGINLNPLDIFKTDIRFYAKPIGAGTKDANGSFVSDDPGNAVIGAGVDIRTPHISHVLIGPSGQLGDFEYFNNDPWSYKNTTADHFFALRNYCRAFMANFNLGTFGTYAYAGISIGECVNYTDGIGAFTQSCIQLRYNYVAAVWEAVIINKYGATTAKKRFVINLGKNPRGVKNFSVGLFMLLEIDYWPNERIDFKIDDKVVLSFTDKMAFDIIGSYYSPGPLLDTYQHETTAGLTLKGCGSFSAIQGAGSNNLNTRFANLTAITFRP